MSINRITVIAILVLLTFATNIRAQEPAAIQPAAVSSVTGTVTSDKGAGCDASTGVTFTNQTGANGTTRTLRCPSTSAQTLLAVITIGHPDHRVSLR